MEFLILAVPFVNNGLMFLVKWLAGLAMFENGARNHPFLRFTLVLLSLIGMGATSLLTGNPIDPDSVSSLALLGLETALSFCVSHIVYRAVAALRKGDITL
jgi:hypothetical protein